MITVDWPTKVINVPLADLTVIAAPFQYELDLDDFRLQLRDREDDEEAMPFLKTHIRIEPFTVGANTKPQIVSIVNGYTVQFEDGQYLVDTTGADSNLLDVLVHNQVSVRQNNSFGTVQVGAGGGGSHTVADKDGFR